MRRDWYRMYRALRRNGWGRWSAWWQAVSYARLRDRERPGCVRLTEEEAVRCVFARHGMT